MPKRFLSIPCALPALLMLTLIGPAHAQVGESDIYGFEHMTGYANRPDPAPRAERIRAESEVRVQDKVDIEREHLANLTQEIAYLRRQVADTAKQAPGAARVQFRYDWLDRDLELIQRGIQEHLDAPRQPRPIPPLKGNYRR
jgi:RAQPRD family integrative conjugative element protein